MICNYLEKILRNKTFSQFIPLTVITEAEDAINVIMNWLHHVVLSKCLTITKLVFLAVTFGGKEKFKKDEMKCKTSSIINIRIKGFYTK